MSAQPDPTPPPKAGEPPERDELLEPDGSERVQLRFLPEGTEVRVPSGTPIFDAASWNGVAIDSTCGGHGTCRKCRVQVLQGEVPVSSVDPRAFEPQELRDGWRLACRAPAREDLVVHVPPLQTRPKAALVGVGRHVILRPAVQKRYVELDEPSLEDQRSDVQRLLDAIGELASEALEEAGVAPEEVYEITLCGNVTMTQLALGIDPEPLSMAPFVVAAHELPPVRALDFGVGVHPRAPAFVFPSMGAYVGGDIVAGLLATGLTRDRRVRLFIDVGTNSEVALGSSERVVATAAPAGPAFEAAQIRCGMRAAEGAIEGGKNGGDRPEPEGVGR